MQVEVEWRGRRIQHRLPGPFAAEPIAYGAAIIVNRSGTNWISGLGGRTQFIDPDDAHELRHALNAGA